jgi:hypothetical protein
LGAAHRYIHGARQDPATIPPLGNPARPAHLVAPVAPAARTARTTCPPPALGMGGYARGPAGGQGPG